MERAVKGVAVSNMTDDDTKRFDERIKKLVKHKPVEKPE
jgi:hypothetical protein